MQICEQKNQNIKLRKYENLKIIQIKQWEKQNN